MNGASGWRNAAVWVWVVGGIEAAVFGCCAGCMGIAAALPPEAYQGTPLPPGTTLPMLRSAMVVFAVVQAVVLVVPAIALVVLGFGVQRGRDGARRAARGILMAQAAILGLLVAFNLVASAATGQLLGALVQAALVSVVIAMQVLAIRALIPAAFSSGPGGTPAGGDDFDEPWNSHLPR